MSGNSEPQNRDGAGEQSVRLTDGTEVVLATWFSRAVARAFDVALVAAAVLLVGGVGFLWGLSRDFSGSSAAWFAGSFGMAAFVLVALYEVLSVVKSGQSVGKSTVGIRVVSLDKENVSRCRSALRWLVPAAAATCGCMLAGLVFFPGEAVSELLFGSVFYVPWFGLPAVWLLLFVMASRDGHRRGVHDRSAGTIVVAEIPASGQR